MQTLDVIKIIILFFVFGLFAPAFGLWIRHRRNCQRATFFAMCFLMIGGFLNAQEWGLTVHSLLYRGTARGFHFFWAEAAAIALIFAQMAGEWRRFRFFPPGMWLYLLYCAASLLSLANSAVPLYSLFAGFKALKMIVIFAATYNFIRSEEDLAFTLSCLAVVTFWELIAVLKQKYVDHIYQVWGTFEHQNSLCMFIILIGMVFLAAAMGPARRHSNLFLAAYIASAAIVQSTLSRGGLAMFAAGTALVVALSLIDRPTKRRLIVLGGLGCIAAIGLLMTLDTIRKRFNDYGNEESQNTRRMLNVSARMMLRDHPLGIGWNNFGVLINPPYPYGDHIDHWQRINGNPVDKTYKKGVVESLWWLLLAETGYQGFATYLLLIAVFLGWNIRNARYFRGLPLGAVSIGLFAGSLMNHAQSFLERVLTQPRNMMLWLILLAMTARITTWRRIDKRRRVAAGRRRFEPALESIPSDSGRILR